MFLRLLSACVLFILSAAAVQAQCVFDPSTGMMVNLDGTPCGFEEPVAAGFLGLPANATQLGLAGINVVAPEIGGLVSVEQNPALLRRSEPYMEAAFHYTTWSPHLLDNATLLQADVNAAPWRRHQIGAQIKLLKYTFLINPGSTFPLIAKPQELAFRLHYAYALGDKWTIGLGATYLTDQFSNGPEIPFVQSTSSQSWAGTIGLKYHHERRLANGHQRAFQWGFSIANFGPTLHFSVSNLSPRDFLPTSLQTGFMWEDYTPLSPGKGIALRLLAQIRKSMVPDMQGRGRFDEAKWFPSMWRSLNDSRDGLLGELKEISIQTAIETQFDLGIDWSVAIRAGYFGDQFIDATSRHLSAGLSFRYQNIHLEASRVLPIEESNNSLRGTQAISLGFRRWL